MRSAHSEAERSSSAHVRNTPATRSADSGLNPFGSLGGAGRPVAEPNSLSSSLCSTVASSEWWSAAYCCSRSRSASWSNGFSR